MVQEASALKDGGDFSSWIKPAKNEASRVKNAARFVFASAHLLL
jgi:hypothetical protein